MSFLLGLEHIRLEYAEKILFDDVSAGVHAHDVVGVVGQNGAGKSSLLRILSGELIPDDGKRTSIRDLSLGTLWQQDRLDEDATVQESIVGDTPQYVWASDARIRNILSALLKDIPWEAQVCTLSGGQRRRVDIARLLVHDYDVLLLDEPTNHLDMQTIAWLAQYLKDFARRRENAVVVVTHDRWFLDEVANRMWEVHGGSIVPFEGGYSAYILQRVERARIQEVTFQRKQNILRKELAWLSRGARARATKPKFHVATALELIGEEPPPRNELELKTLAVARLGKLVIDFTNVSFSYDSKPILRNVDITIGPGDRIGILGANGAGKTSLLSLFQKKLQPQSGFIKIGKTVQFGVLSQRLDELEDIQNDRVTEVLTRYPQYVEVDGKPLSASKLLERLGFNKKQLYSRVRDLSGGEKRRMQLMLTLITQPNVLILDEPGNDLDTDMLSVLEDVLDTWAGTLIVVTHDRHLMERVTDNQYALIDGALTHVPRGVDEYIQMQAVYDTSHVTHTKPWEDVLESPEATAPKKEESALSNAEIHAYKKQMTSLERRMETLDVKISEKHAEMGTVDVSDYEELARIQGEISQLQETKAELEATWLEIAEMLV